MRRRQTPAGARLAAAWLFTVAATSAVASPTGEPPPSAGHSQYGAVEDGEGGPETPTETFPETHEDRDHPAGKAPPEIPAGSEIVKHEPGVFKADPVYPDTGYDPAAQQAIYGGKHLNPTARPLIELGRPLYRSGPLNRAGDWLGKNNPTAPHLMVYGDARLAAAYNELGVADASGETFQSTVALRLNLDVDFKITATERLHMFVRPTLEEGRFTRYDLGGRNEGFEGEFDLEPETLFFEGELGPILHGMTGRPNRIDLPFAVGLFPLFTQNGVWAEDAINGLGFTFPAFSSDALDASNVDLTFFAAFDDVTTAAVPRPGKAEADGVYGFAGFVEANQGYWEFGYGYVDAGLDDLSYHNATLSFTRRWGGWLGNSVRIISNAGQDPVPGREKTADGVLLLVENHFITSRPYTLVPYLNLYAGWDRPQALVRAADAGGVLKNTGINFETDGVTGFPKLDDRAHDSFGGALGLQYLFDLDQQIVVEAALVQRIGGGVTDALGDQYALGMRWQKPLTHALILRADVMHAWADVGEDFYGFRLELRRKF